MATLYEIKADMQALLDNAEEDDQVFLDTLEAVQGELEVKAEGYGVVMETMANKATFLRNEAKKLIERAEKIEKRHDHIEERLLNVLVELDMKSLSTDHFEYKVQNNPPKVVYDIPEKELIDQIDAKFITEKVTKSISKTLVKEAIENGENITFAHIERGKKLKY